MKRKSQSLECEFKMIHLFRDDLTEIERILNQLSPKDLKLSAEEYEYDTVEEIPEETAATHDFSIRVSQPYINVTFGKYGARLYVTGDSLQERGAFDTISRILHKRERRIRHMFTALPAALLPYLVGFLVIAVSIIALNRFGTVDGDAAAASVAVFSVVWWLLFMIFTGNPRLLPHSTVEFVAKAKRHSFFQRNKDSLITTALGAILGGLITWAIT